MTAPVTVAQSVARAAPAPGRRLTAAQIAQIALLLRAQAQVRQQLTETAIAAAVAPLRAFTAWWDAAAVRRVINRVLAIVQPAQLRAARSTDVFAAQVLTILTGERFPPVGAVDITRLRRRMSQQTIEDLVAGRREPAWLEIGDNVDGPNDRIDDDVELVTYDDEFADPADAYGRVADGYRYNIVANGESPDVAAQKALVRIAAVAQTDITLAIREQYRAAFDRDRVQAWRRILRPDLGAGGPPCGLCVVAADRVYRKEDLQPIHDNCRCEVLPIIDGLDPALRLNQRDLEAIYRAAGNTGGDVITRDGRRASRALKRIRVALSEHGELGPVLVDAGHRRRGPVEVARTQHPDRRVRARAQLDSLERTLAALEGRHDRGELDDDRALRWQRAKVAELRRELGLARAA